MVKLILGNQPFQRAASLYIRYCVFVLEKGIDKEEEFDGFDEKDSIYAVVYDGEKPVSTGRFLPQTAYEARLTRIATLKEYRGLGYGAQIIQSLEKLAKTKGYQRLVIHSELTAKSFYESLGYQACSDTYIEDGEICQTLEKNITR
ncbi:GNAT family N-acetyltransferase [Streptococcus didelphis]|uniref:GNAT family N-acetyltransferase n=1 Tax=Streptococcus didelphis TaxID=102886 RepID=UPI000367AB99|nr:GNAT family N-acetyltransferase [Streptococcus didelphis]